MTGRLRRFAKDVAWRLGYRPAYGNYGVEQRPHLGGYWRGGDPNTMCPTLWEAVVARYGIRSVIDVGCGEGHSTKYFTDLGLTVQGVEGGADAVRHNLVPHLVVQHDYTTGPYVPKDTFDLAWCCEFVEHVEERFVPNFLATFRAARFLLMTHALPGQDGYHHVNCRTPGYWIEQLSTAGFDWDECATRDLRALTDAKHVRDTLLFFRRAGDPSAR